MLDYGVGMDESEKNLESLRPQTTYLLTPAYEFVENRSDGAEFARYLFALWRKKGRIALVTVLSGLAVLFATLLLPKTYQARATLLLQPSSFSTDLKPAPFSVQTYQSILSSDYVAEKLRQELIESKVLLPSVALEEFKSQLSVETFVEKETDQPGARPYLPIIELVAEAESPEIAKIMANRWAELFTRETVSLSSRVKSGTLDFIETQYPSVSKSLNEKEGDAQEKSNYYDDKLLALKRQWAQKILDFTNASQREQNSIEDELDQLRTDLINETTQARSQFETETELLKQSSQSKLQLDVLTDELEIRRKKLSDFKLHLIDIDLKLQTQKNLLREIKDQIQSQPQFLTLSKAISDEALWGLIGSASGQIPEKLEKLRLRTEVLNPSHQSLLSQLIEAQIAFNTLTPDRQHITDEIAHVETEIDDLKNKIADANFELFNLGEAREAELETLLKKRELKYLIETRRLELKLKQTQERDAAQLALLQQTRDNEVGKVTREKTIELARISRETESLRNTFELLAQKHSSAQLSKAEEEPDVKIGAPAVAPQQPVSPRPFVYAALALIATFVLSVSVVVTGEFVRSLLEPKEAFAADGPVSQPPRLAFGSERSAGRQRKMAGE